MTSIDSADDDFQPKNLLFLIDMETASSWYRCNTPGSELAKCGHNVRVKARYNNLDLDWCDVLVLQRLWQPGVVDAVKHVRDRGKLTVFDVDDDYWSIHVSNPAYTSWQKPGALDALARVIRATQVVTTTTASLAARLKNINPNVKVIPNSLPGDLWPAEPKIPSEEDSLVVGWAGSVSHYVDLREVAAIFPQVLERYPHVEVRLAGSDPAWFPPHERIVFADIVPIPDYPGLLSDFDIALAPLEDTRFNTSKSDLKLVEYSMIGLPVIASKVPAYADSIRPGETGLLAKNPKDWLRHLKTLIEQPDVRLKMGAEARKWAETRVISKTIDLWLDAYGLER